MCHGLPYPEQATLDFLGQILFHMDENKQQLILHRRQGRVLVRDIPTMFAWQAINGARLHRF
jgi:hypothetical protein